MMMTAAVVEELEAWCKHLRVAADAEHDAVVDPADQLAVENMIAAGIAVLASEALPEPATEVSDRRILAQDLLITADLVRRALEAQR